MTMKKKKQYYWEFQGKNHLGLYNRPETNEKKSALMSSVKLFRREGLHYTLKRKKL